LASTEWRITSAQQIVRLSRVKPIAVGAEGASIKNIDDENRRPIYFATVEWIDGRASDQLRPVAFELGIAPYAGRSVLVTMGNTRVICGVTIEETPPGTTIKMFL